MSEHVIANPEELSEGDRLVVELEGKEIAVFQINNEYHAYLNWCPHQSGPVCEGNLTGTHESTFDRDSLEMTTEWAREGEVLNCPWHGWEFNINNGECLSREGIKLPSYPVYEEDGKLMITL
jgi:nitrite reductase/ring-hydroxylating ferredoxin subunit